ncbi:MAG: hypothetical protein HUJ68_01910 [Clostridia bacterium]|nr:hypothetical protein [Clostridia bacterium]
MEIAKENFFKIGYNTRLRKEIIRKESIKNKIVKRIKKHKIMSGAVMLLIALSTVNLMMIYSFFKILQNI